MQTTFKLIAHRGASAEAPENTLVAMHQAVEIGVDFIEFDVRLTRDGIPVIFHDASLARTTTSRKALHICDLNFEQIRELDAGSWFDPKFSGEKIPTLEEVLQAKFKPSRLMIEIKSSYQPASKITEKTLEVIEKTKFNPDSFVIGSMSLSIIEELQRQAPHLNIIGIAEKAQNIAIFLERNINLMALWYKLLDPSLIEFLHKRNVEVWSFTIDDPKVASSLQACSIDGIITNHPRVIRQQCFI